MVIDDVAVGRPQGCESLAVAAGKRFLIGTAGSADRLLVFRRLGLHDPGRGDEQGGDDGRRRDTGHEAPGKTVGGGHTPLKSYHAAGGAGKKRPGLVR